MAERINRRDLIVEVATRLFMEKGYQATSVREIADEVGCTEAALYYHFKEGKREIFKAIFEIQAPQILNSLNLMEEATSLKELILFIGQGITAMPHRDKIQWMAREIHNLDPEERAMLTQTLMEFHDRAEAMLKQFLSSKEQIEIIGWLIMCAGIGYQVLFRKLEMHEVTGITAEDMARTVIDMLDC